MEKYTELLNELISQFNICKTANDLIIAKNVFTKKHLSPLYAQLKDLPSEQKHDFGKELNIFKNKINELFEARKQKIDDELSVDTHKPLADLSIDSTSLAKGTLSPINLISNEIIDFFRKLNFTVVGGDEVTTVKYNFDNLNVPEDHPGRQTSESLYFNKDLMLRAHTTASTAEQILLNNKSTDLRVLSVGNVYRNDDDDLSHSHQFNQIDVIWVKDGLTVANLKWLMSSLLKHLYGPDVKIRYRMSFFPFTEPSIEADIECPTCHGKGCSLCKKSGWLEIFGAGMLHQNVLKKANVNCKTAIAAGFGIDRLAMIKYGINDIRYLYTNDFRFSNQFKKGGK